MFKFNDVRLGKWILCFSIVIWCCKKYKSTLKIVDLTFGSILSTLNTAVSISLNRNFVSEYKKLDLRFRFCSWIFRIRRISKPLTFPDSTLNKYLLLARVSLTTEIMLVDKNPYVHPYHRTE